MYKRNVYFADINTMKSAHGAFKKYEIQGE